VGQLLIKLTPKKRIASYQGTQILLTNKIPSDPEINKLIVAYNTKVKELQPKPPTVPADQIKISDQFVTGSGCADCHFDQYNNWTTTRHAEAINSLLELDKGFDVDCVGCHSTGYGMPGGFVNIEQNFGLTSVQCEACHGPGRKHIQSQDKKGYGKIKEEVCKKCHTPEHSPKFNYNEYVKKVNHKIVQPKEEEESSELKF